MQPTANRHTPRTLSACGSHSPAKLDREHAQEARGDQEARDLDRSPLAETETAHLHPNRVVA